MLDLVSRFQNRLEAKFDKPTHHGQRIISAALAPRDDERAALEARRHELRAALAPVGFGEDDEQDGERKRIGKAIATLLGAFPTFGISPQAARDLVSITVRALDGIPLWAVREASKRFVRLENVTTWDPAKAPTAPQIRAEALQVMLPVEAELHRLSQILDAEIVDVETTQGERDAAVARWTEIRAGIARTNGIAERTPEEIARERAEQARANARFVVAPLVVPDPIPATPDTGKEATE